LSAAGAPVRPSIALPAGVRSPPAPAARPTPDATRRHADHASGQAFCATVARYLASVLPRATRELWRWRRRAAAIPDPVLRRLALDALSKRGNIEGAALFAVLAPRGRRGETVRALVAFQTAYNYLDALAEQPSADPVGNGRQLHQALLVALAPAASHVDCYALNPQREDGGLLAALVETCRTALATLPSHAAVAPGASAAAARIVAFQSLNLTERQGGHEQLERWARRRTPRHSGLRWWETAAAGGSSLAVHALIALAAHSDVRQWEVEAIQAAYFPWIGALHSLLDSLADVAEDERAGQRNLLSYHGSPEQSALALTILARRAIAAARGLPDGVRHEVILTAMATYYLSSAEAATPYARTIADSVAAALGPLVAPALALFKARRAVAWLVHGGYR
jgi:tetraprenyl-beta-curcumene synthase